MKKEDKKLLLIDLSARLPYGVICDCLHDYHTEVSAVDTEDSTVYYPYCDEWENIEYCKPYLRPMSSMTEKEKKELGRISCEGNIEHKYGIFYRSQDYLNSIHVDYRGLIEKKLALEAPENMYSIESKE